MYFYLSMKTARVILYQKPLGISVPKADLTAMKEFRPHFVCFPEYFFVNRSLGNHGQTVHNQKRQLCRIKAMSRFLDTVIIGGTMPEIDGGNLYNTCFVLDSGELLGRYRKKNLFFKEIGAVTPGDSYRTFTARGLTFGVIICADVFHDESFRYMKNNNARVVFSPTFSLYKNETIEEKFKRDEEIYVRGAGIADAVIVKVCGVKSDYKPFLQARSLIADKTGIVYRVRPDEEDRAMVIKKEIKL